MSEEFIDRNSAAIPDDLCSMCMRPEETVGELVMCEVIYPDCGSRKKICIECKDRLHWAIVRAVEQVGWKEPAIVDKKPKKEKRMINRLWRYITSRWRKRSYAQAILKEKPVAYYRLGGETQKSTNPLLNRPPNPGLDIIRDPWNKDKP